MSAIDDLKRDLSDGWFWFDLRAVEEEMRALVAANPPMHPAWYGHIADGDDITDWAARIQVAREGIEGMMKNTTEALMSGIQEMQGARHDITELREKLAERDHQLATMRKRLRQVEQ